MTLGGAYSRSSPHEEATEVRRTRGQKGSRCQRRPHSSAGKPQKPRPPVMACRLLSHPGLGQE